MYSCLPSTAVRVLVFRYLLETQVILAQLFFLLLILVIGDFMIFYPHERMALFVDGANLYSAAKSLGFEIDYRRLLDLFISKGQLVRAFYYTALIEEQDYSPIRPLVDWLDYNGFTMAVSYTHLTLQTILLV